MSQYHTPVLLQESLSALNIQPSGIYADATFGGGGHTAGVLSRLNDDGKVIAFDRDTQALANRLDDPRLILVHNNFRYIHNYALLAARKGFAALVPANGTEDQREEASAERSVERSFPIVPANEADRPAAANASPDAGFSAATDGAIFDGILADLGVSSHQFDTAERGFSFRFDAPLDMRMNTQEKRTAADVVNESDEAALERIFTLYGEVEQARKAARLVVAARNHSPILTTTQLDRALESILPRGAEHKVLAKVYQALRIEVNQEMRALEKFLQGAARSLKCGGRLVVITYHSLEDRMVKNFIRTGNVEGVENKDLFGVIHAPLKAVNRKPILPQEVEIAGNTRARSAKLRVGERVAGQPVQA